MFARNIEQSIVILATVVVGFACPFILLFLGQMLGGAGHGSLFFFYLAGSPVSAFATYESEFLIAPLFWMLTTVFLTLRRWPFARKTLVALMVAHYAGIPLLLLKEDWSTLVKTCTVLAPFVLCFLAIYVSPQLVLWRWLKKARQESSR